MNRLVVRLILSHVCVVVIGGVATYVLVRTLVPAELNRGRLGWGHEQVYATLDHLLLLGVVVAMVTASAVGVMIAVQLSRPLSALGTATRFMARGDYRVDVPIFGVQELDALAGDVRTLGTAVRETEARRVRLLGEVAHEMRTPLTIIKGNVEGMIDGVVEVTPERLQQLLAETRRLQRLGDDVSMLSRAEEGRLGLCWNRTDLRDVVCGVAERLRPQAVDAGISLDLGCPEQPVWAEVDADRVAQIVTNVLGNALRATPSGGSVRVTLVGERGGARVQVSDTGVGLAAEDCERIFERFYRVPVGEGARAGTLQGSGIGLTISRGIARAHGGDVVASSRGLGLGTTVTVTLPYRPPSLS